MPSFVMSTVFQMEQMMSWVVRKYVKFLVLGALSSCALVNVALHAGAGMQYYCQEDCMIKLLETPLKSMDFDAIKHIRKHWVDEGSTPGTYVPSFPIETPPWSNMGNWGEAYKFINNYFKPYKTPGTFMEIGAQDGEFMSLTLYVEKELGFRGVLVEPNPNDYGKLRARGRTAKSINACATPGHWAQGGSAVAPRHAQQPPADPPPHSGGKQQASAVRLQRGPRAGQGRARAVLQPGGHGGGGPRHDGCGPADHLHARRRARHSLVHPAHRQVQDDRDDRPAGQPR
ncbi:uncharacterized protein LOC125042159 [Penaeus chinensis]|uniref:uncharacterized protein LOC125042159 n=1 Tax=Penaeus chinensis TaxID=139456 RepID=UPI001FB845DF|nr:uncharacterized protein LOC125042159 [Penaeus chinensis]